MPANLSPEYKAAEAAFRSAREPQDRLHWLREMLRTIPKHKGTDHLQADIKTRIKQLTEELAGPKKGAAHGGPVTAVHPEGAAQVALIGPPNVGKSALHAGLTGSHAHVGPYPFTTLYPQPGMLPFEDTLFQLLDLPPVSPEHPAPWLGNALQQADACLLVVDLSDPLCVDQMTTLHEGLSERRVHLSARWTRSALRAEQEALADPFALLLPTLLLANKADIIPGLADELGVFRELTGLDYPVLLVSAEAGAGLAEIGPWLFRELEIVRVYTKVPGRPPEQERPFTLRRGDCVGDVAGLVHRDFTQSFKFARMWRRGRKNVLQVGRDHPVEDGDLLELHV
ncbi:MAG: GTPase [Pseudomonadota bacterium]|nr:GTPase [Pseudomonadota bacterium]